MTPEQIRLECVKLAMAHAVTLQDRHSQGLITIEGRVDVRSMADWLVAYVTNRLSDETPGQQEQDR